MNGIVAINVLVEELALRSSYSVWLFLNSPPTFFFESRPPLSVNRLFFFLLHSTHIENGWLNTFQSFTKIQNSVTTMGAPNLHQQHSSPSWKQGQRGHRHAQRAVSRSSYTQGTFHLARPIRRPFYWLCHQSKHGVQTLKCHHLSKQHP